MDINPSDTDPSMYRPYHTKRPHKKSRAGCLNCKKRKVKCNEARPVCGNCILRHGECVYPEPTGASGTSSRPFRLGSSSQPSTPGQAPRRDGASAPPQSDRLPDDSVTIVREPLFIPAPVSDATDLKLMWFYTTNTFASFTTTRNGSQHKVNEILKVKIPAYAFQHPFLMDTLLGLSAIQLQHREGGAGLLPIEPTRIYRYRARAFEGYRHAVEAADPETYPALMASSLLLVGIASQSFREPDGKDLFILDWMILWRGIGLIFDLIKARGLWQSGIAELFYRPPIDLDQAALHIPNSLLFMILSTLGSTASGLSAGGDRAPTGMDEYDLEVDPAAAASSRAAYYSTLQYLGSLYQELRNDLGPRLHLRIITWFTFLPDHFIRLASARRPRALIIIAHYLMFVKLVSGIWWVRGIADREIPSIARQLLQMDPRIRDWATPYLASPLAITKESSPLAIARIILEDPNWNPPPAPLVQHQPLEPPPAAHASTDDEEYSDMCLLLVNNKGRYTRYNPDTSSFVELEPTKPTFQAYRQDERVHIMQPSPSPSASTSSTTYTGPGTSLEDVRMDQLHLEPALHDSSMDIVLGELRDMNPERPG